VISRPVLAAAAAGLIAGVVGSLVANGFLNGKPSRAAGPVNLSGEDWQRLESPSSRSQQAIAALALADKAHRESANGQAPAAVGPPPLPGREREMSEFRQALADHAREPESPAWASRVGQALSADLKGFKEEAGISRFELACRSKTCAGVIEWPSPIAARQNLARVLHTAYKINSAVRLGLPDAAGDGPFRVEVIFEPVPGT
jgi:hypothetical protein